MTDLVQENGNDQSSPAGGHEAAPRSRIRRLGLVAAAVVLGGLGACTHMMMMLHGGPDLPAETEFGFGPRVSAAGVYSVTLEPVAPLVKRKLQKVRVRVHDDGGRPIDGATIEVDGGMPQHGHGLPTRPRMTKRLGDGVYEIDGVRFNMGGWWEFRLAIADGVRTDTVTFNLSL
ncbi:MAG TPA: FixH family protein [Longimicrobiales bacterium]|nr:FixH family protein [Longimicrobiales bacterium]